MPISILLSATLFSAPVPVLRFQKINPDSVKEVTYSNEGYTSRSTTTIYCRMQNGDSVNILYDKGAGLRPMAISLSKNKAWLVAFTCQGSDDNCVELLCSLPNGICKNAKILDDSGYTFSDLSDSVAGGTYLINKKKFIYEKISGKKKKVRNYATKYVTEAEMMNQFLGKSGIPIGIGN